MISPDVTLIIKVTNSCNMRCSDCFIEPSVFHKTMKSATARRVVRAFLDSSYFRSVQFVWHGGEPLLRGRDFFEDILSEQRRRPTRVSFLERYADERHAPRQRDDGFPARQWFRHRAEHGQLGGHQRQVTTDAQRDHRSAHAITVDAARRLHERGQQAAAIVVIPRCSTRT